MKLLKHTFLSLLLIFSFLSPVLVTGTVFAAADISNNLCKGADLRFSGSANCAETTKDSSQKLDKLVSDIVNIFSVIVGVVAVIMIIYGGFRYITSGGDSGNVTNAKNTILYALVGLVIVALAQFIVKFVLSKATNLGN
ncbi:MAG: pilin [Patescibacteria group bacterium]